MPNDKKVKVFCWLRAIHRCWWQNALFPSYVWAETLTTARNTNNGFDFWCFNVNFSNMSAISWCPVLVVEEYPERTTDHGQANGKLYHLRLRVECTLFCNLKSRARTHAVSVIVNMRHYISTTMNSFMHHVHLCLYLWTISWNFKPLSTSNCTVQMQQPLEAGIIQKKKHLTFFWHIFLSQVCKRRTQP
jgi:hypothetical protein